MLVKICGITNVKDAIQSVSCGTDFIGLVMVPGSSRYVSVDKATEIVLELKKLKSCPLVVGVFQDSDVDTVNDIAAKVGLDMVQLHGKESFVYISKIRLPVIKAVGVTALDNADTVFREVQEYKEAKFILLDTKGTNDNGGSGVVFDWSIAAELSRRGVQFLIAGGLTPENVKYAIDATGAMGVDVASGTEATKGAKDKSKVQNFIINAKE